MATAVATCPLCGGPLADDRNPCPQCHASPEWIEVGSALAFVVRRFEEWQKQGHLSEARLRALAAGYQRRRETCARLAAEGRPVPEDLELPWRDRCWSCHARADSPPEYCSECGAPWDTPAARSLRFLSFLIREIKEQGDAGRLPLALAHGGAAEVRQRVAALRRKMEKDRLPAVTAAPPRGEKAAARRRGEGREELSPAWVAPRRSALEILLDPRTIQGLLAGGGALLVIGLVIYLATSGFFDNPLTVAVALGLGNAVVLVGGWVLLARGRYPTAGRALTLLACLVMPLNLWYYHANGLMVIEGRLWVAALVCCALYAASALVLRDPLFVYVLFGGVALTGLLMLAHAHHFHEIALPSALLVALGLVGIHGERLFPEGDGPFTRRQFGLASFWSGQALLGAGLLLLLVGQLVGWLYLPLFQFMGVAAAPEVFSRDTLQLLAIGLTLAGTYAYVYSDVVVRRVGVYMYLAVFTLLWAEVLIVRRLHLPVSAEAAIAVMALTALAFNLAQATAARGSASLARLVPPLGVFLSAVPVGLGVLLHFRATNAVVNDLWRLDDGAPYEITGWYVASMVLTAVSCRVGAHLFRHTQPWVSTVYFFGTAAATLAGAAGLLSVLGTVNPTLKYLVGSWDHQAAVLMLIPLAYLVASHLYRGHSAERPLVWVAHAATAFMVLGVITASLEITPQRFGPLTGQPSNRLLALFCAEAAAFYTLATWLRKEGWTIYPATAMACGTVWQLLLYFGVSAPEYYALAFGLLGFALLLTYRLALLERFEKGGLAAAAFGSANALMSLACLAAAVLSLSHLATGHSVWSLVPLLALLSALSLASAGLVRHPVWRPLYVLMAIAEALMLFVTLEVLADLNGWQKAELFAVVVGVLLLAVGHWGTYRERASDEAAQSDAVTLALVFGSLLAGLPLAIAVLVHRGSSHHYSVPDEVGLLAAGVLLLASGYVLRIQATTLTGAFLLALNLLTLPMLIRRIYELQTTALLLAGGGALVFVLGLVLSVFRDRLLNLPEKVKRREGVFRVLGWR
jgi:hypothetical protein